MGFHNYHFSVCNCLHGENILNWVSIACMGVKHTSLQEQKGYFLWKVSNSHSIHVHKVWIQWWFINWVTYYATAILEVPYPQPDPSYEWVLGSIQPRPVQSSHGWLIFQKYGIWSIQITRNFPQSPINWGGHPWWAGESATKSRIKVLDVSIFTVFYKNFQQLSDDDKQAIFDERKCLKITRKSLSNPIHSSATISYKKYKTLD